MKFNEKFKILTIFFLFLANFYAWQFVFQIDGNLRIIFFDIGQGDSVLVLTPEGHQILIDGGPAGKKVLEKLGKYIPFWDRTIDIAILSHPDSDHLTGLNSVLQRYSIQNVLWTGAIKETKVFGQWLENLKKEKSEGAKIFIAKKGMEIKIEKAKIFIFYPFESLEGKIVDSESNDSSLVLKLIFGNKRFLFPGDIGKKTEGDILVRSDFPESLSADVIKIPHHGSRTSNSEEFLRLINPQFAVISCSKNNQFSHPHQETLQALQNFGINILRTDEIGDIEIVSDGNYFNIKSQK